jgi:P22 coat protein - gene protein 5
VANTFITPTWVTKDVAVSWKNNIKLVGNFDRQWDRTWENLPQGAKIGDTAQVRIPQRFMVTEGQAFQQQAILNQTVPISINHQYQVGMGWSSADTALRVEEVQERYTMPAGRALASKADVQAGAEVYFTVYNSVGTPGTAITDDVTYTDGVAKLRNLGVPEELIAVLDPKSQSKLLAANFALFNPQAQISKYFRSGQFAGAALGIDEWYWDPLMPTHTTGTFTTATPIVSSANQTGSTLAMSGLGTFAFKKGDIFTVAGVNSVNPVSYSDTGDLQQFVITADTSGTTTGTLPISPPIITSGQLQTVTTSPANSAVVTFLGATGTVSATMATTTSKQSLVFNPGAFAFVAVDLPANLAGANTKRVNDADARISMRWTEQYQFLSDQNPSKVEMLVGVAAIVPQFAFRCFS